VTAETTGRALPGLTLDDRYLRTTGDVYLNGVQALVRLVLDRARAETATRAYVTGYAGSPLGGYDLELARRRSLLEPLGVVHRPALNEELAATAVVGTQLVGRAGTATTEGVTGYWYGKAPGLDRASDAVRHANLIGTSPRGGAVAFVGDDPAAKSSTFPCASEAALADLHLPTFHPADPGEVLSLGLHAVELSRASGLWTAIKITTTVADGAATVAVPDRAVPMVSGRGAYAHVPDARVLGATLAALERSLYEVRLPLALEYLAASGVNQILGATRAARVGVVVAGATYLTVRQALASMGLDDEGLVRHGVRLLKLGAVHPLEPGVVRAFADGLHEIVVVEEKRGFLEAALKEVLYGAGAPPVHGKHGPDGVPLFRPTGELDADLVAAGLARRLAAHLDLPAVRDWRPVPRPRQQLPLAARTPYFCSGCPHNSSTKVPAGTLVGAGIGCHAMVALMPVEQVGEITGMTQMGGEGGHWIGMETFVTERHFVQNLGDGTFAHSGSLAVRAAVAAGVTMTFKLLANSAVAMTGGQPVVGGMPVGRLVRLLLAEGVTRVVVTSDDPARLTGLPRGVSVRHRDELVDVQRELAAVTGVTVLVHDQECAAEKRRGRRRGQVATPPVRVIINERVCEGCGDCGQKSNCLSMQPVATEFGRKTRIHQSSCNVDLSCLQGDCPSFMTVTPGDRAAAAPPVLDVSGLPEPAHRFSADAFGMRITGIGGTGVVTVAQVLATAAAAQGLDVRTLDMTGLAQKGGAVVSDLRLSRGRRAVAPKLAAGECDLYLGCDSLVATDPAHLRAVDPARTVAVVSTTEVATGWMVVDPGRSFPGEGQVRTVLDDACAQAFYLDARALALELFGDDQYANLLQVGAAYQAGTLPLAAEAIEAAIRLNGVRVDANLLAFRAGRQYVADPARLRSEPVAGQSVPTGPGVPASLRSVAHAVPGSELDRLLAVRLPDLVAYQDLAYARTYAAFVEAVRLAEDRAVPGSSAVTEAVARNLYKLMAYKDEYEVARLWLDPAVPAGVEHDLGAGAAYRIRLHPPALRALGMRRKIALGPASRPVLVALRSMRRLRGTRLDPFGLAAVRRLERSLIVEYRAEVSAALGVLAPSTVADVAELAGLPDLVRGYEDVKLRSVAAYRSRLAEVRARLPRS
jgi:indolepyruvate ferredoxin oxidoreductase